MQTLKIITSLEMGVRLILDPLIALAQGPNFDVLFAAEVIEGVVEAILCEVLLHEVAWGQYEGVWLVPKGPDIYREMISLLLPRGDLWGDELVVPFVFQDDLQLIHWTYAKK